MKVCVPRQPENKHNIYVIKSWVFKKEQEANRVREDWVMREDSRVEKSR